MAGSTWTQRIAAAPVHLYRATLSWLLGGHCRFTPTCSVYALEAIEKHGAWKGWYLAVRRLMRCQPFCAGGYDPVPEAKAGCCVPHAASKSEQKG